MLQLKDIYFQYEPPPLIEEFNLQVKKGEKVVIQGPSGSGKTTLLYLIMGFESPTQGNIFIDRYPLTARSIRVLRRKMAWLPQNPSFPAETVQQVINFPFTLKHNKHHTPTQDQINNLLRDLQLPISILEQPVNNISGGEKQRIGVLICLLLDRPLFLLDEPTNHLDTDIKEVVSRLILQAPDRTVISTSHDKEWIQYCDKSITL